jgi:flagellin
VVSAGGAASGAAFGGNSTTAGSVAVNGALGSQSITIAVNDTAKAIADKINLQTANTGVTASARTETQLTFAAAGAYSLNLRSDNATNESISFSLSAASGADGLSSAISAINEKASKTGVIASLNTAGSGIILTNATGNDIYVGDTAVQNAGNVSVIKQSRDISTGALAAVTGTVTLTADTTADNSVSSGYITLDSEKSYAVVVTTSNAFTNAASTLKKVSDLDVSSVIKASDALKTVDSALGFISGERAKLGALQSRFDTAIANLQVTSENLTASRSRILDADFAQETANLSRAQILQQAATAMVAQANQLPQGVLALLR